MLHGIILLPFVFGLPTINASLINLFWKYQTSPLTTNHHSTLNLTNSRFTHPFSTIIYKDIYSNLLARKSFFAFLQDSVIVDEGFKLVTNLTFKSTTISEWTKFEYCSFVNLTVVRRNAKLINLGSIGEFSYCLFSNIHFKAATGSTIYVSVSSNVTLDDCLIEQITSTIVVTNPFLYPINPTLCPFYSRRSNFTKSTFTGNFLIICKDSPFEISFNVFEEFGVLDKFMSITHMGGDYVFHYNKIINQKATTGCDFEFIGDANMQRITFEGLCVAYREGNDGGNHFSFEKFDGTVVELINCCFSRAKENWFGLDEGIMITTDLVTDSDRCDVIHPFVRIVVPLIGDKSVSFIGEKRW